MAADSTLWRDVWGDQRAAAKPADLAFTRLRQTWIDTLSALPAVSAALELGAGAAAQVSRLIVERMPGVRVTASDFRPIPGDIPGLTYVADAPMERLPFNDAAFDLVVSQFAFEYAQRAPAAAEMVRVLVPGGAARLVLHCQGAYFDRYLPHRLDCLTAGAAVAQAIGSRPALNDVGRLKLKAALRRIEALIVQKADLADVVADLRDFQDIGRRRLAGEAGPDPDGDALFLAACAPTLALAKAQAAATLGEDDMPALMAAFTAAGFDAPAFSRIEGGPGGLPIAWMVSLRRAG